MTLYVVSDDLEIVSDDYKLYRLFNTITGITGILSVTQPKISLPFIHIRTRPINRTQTSGKLITT